MTEPIHVISLGAGVQSTTMALMAAHGEITPMPVAAVFADTGAEPKAVYEHLDWLRSGNVLPFPVHVVKWRDLANDLRASADRTKVAGRTGGYVAAPFQTVNSDGSRGLLRRECTQNYKIKPIHHEIKRILGRDPNNPIRLKKGQGPIVRQWIGISADEWHRVKNSKERWCEKRHPLIEDGRWMTRGHCLEWMVRHGYPTPPRSACVFCPYQATQQWRAVAAVPDDWALAVEIDRMIRDFPDKKVAGLRKGGRLFVHHSGKALEDVDLTDPHADQLNLWGNECEGMCGV